jgi:hypothetical protein
MLLSLGFLFFRERFAEAEKTVESSSINPFALRNYHDAVAG